MSLLQRRTNPQTASTQSYSKESRMGDVPISVDIGDLAGRNRQT